MTTQLTDIAHQLGYTLQKHPRMLRAPLYSVFRDGIKIHGRLWTAEEVMTFFRSQDQSFRY